MTKRLIAPLSFVLLTAAMLTGCAPEPTNSAVLTGGGLTAEEADYLAESEQAVRDTVGCLRDLGWPVTESDGGWEVAGLDESQMASYDNDTAQCQQESGLATFAPLPDSPERIARLYAYETALAECLRAEGFEVPAAPSEQAFREQLDGSSPWFAYGFVDAGDLTQEEWSGLERACPPYGTLSQ